MKILILLVCLISLGCRDTRYSRPQEAVIIEVRKLTFSETPFPDWITVVEFKDRSRFRRAGKWGEVGDTVLAVKVWLAYDKNTSWWETPVSY